MIKNKTLNIKFIFKNIKNRLKTFQVPKQTFLLQNTKEQFLKTVIKNYLSELHSKTVAK